MSSNYTDLERAYEEASIEQDGPVDNCSYSSSDDDINGYCSCDVCDDYLDDGNSPDDFDDAESSEPQMWFDKAMQTVLGGALETATQRGQEYADSWHEDNQQTPFGDFLRREVYGDTKIVKRLTMLAALCDVKLSRLAGGWKKDTFVDLINYIAAFAYALENDIFNDGE